MIHLPPNPQEGMIHEGLTVRTIYSKSWRLVECFMEKEGVLEGQCHLYYPDGTLKAESFYQKGLLEGTCTSYSQTGILLAKSNYIANLLEGEVLWYYASGAPYSRQQYHKGEWHGLQEFFYEDGSLKTRLQYNNGRLLPPPILLTESGKPLVRELRWKK